MPVDGQPIVARQQLAPGLPIAVNGPVVPVEPPPEDGPAIPVQKLLGDHAAIIHPHIHHADRVEGLSVDGHGIPPHDVQQECLFFESDHRAASLNLALPRQMDFAAAVVLPKAPAGQERVLIQKGHIPPHAVLCPHSGQVAAVGVRQLGHKGSVDCLFFSGTGAFPGGQVHALDAMDLGPAGNLHVVDMAALPGWHVVHPPGQLLSQPGDQEPTHQLFPANGEGSPLLFHDCIFRQ